MGWVPNSKFLAATAAVVHDFQEQSSDPGTHDVTSGPGLTFLGSQRLAAVAAKKD